MVTNISLLELQCLGISRQLKLLRIQVLDHLIFQQKTSEITADVEDFIDDSHSNSCDLDTLSEFGLDDAGDLRN